LESIQNKKAEAKEMAKAKNFDGAEKVMAEINDLQKQFDIESQLVEDEKGEIAVKNNIQKPENKENMAVRAFKRALVGKPLTEEMKAALVSNVDADGGYLVPSEIATDINELRRDYPSLKSLVEVIPVGTSKGSIVVEDLSTIQNLVNFDEVTDLAEQQPKFKQVQFALANKGAITPISNILLQDETAGLPSYVVRNFAKKAVRTENADIISALKSGKTAKSYTNIASLKKSFNKDLDPALLAGAAFILNQDAFNHLDQEVDSNGRPILQQNIADASQKTLFGLPVFVISNTELPTTGTTTKLAPVFFGNFVEGLKFFDREVYEVSVSTEAGFAQNKTLLKVIERYDVRQADVDAYIFGNLDVTATV
jgi:HK97 family phage major capsid protein